MTVYLLKMISKTHLRALLITRGAYASDYDLVLNK